MIYEIQDLKIARRPVSPQHPQLLPEPGRRRLVAAFGQPLRNAGVHKDPVAMTKIFKYVYETGVLFGRYSAVHKALFRVSFRKLLQTMLKGNAPDSGQCMEELQALTKQLQEIQAGLEELPADEMALPRNADIRTALTEYITALLRSIDSLNAICSGLSELRGTQLDEAQTLSSQRADYDQAVQEHKRLGTKLNKLLSSF